MQTVKVRLRKPSRVFTFLSNNIALQRDDTCVVRSDRGLEYGRCVLPPEPCGEEEERRFKMNVIRKSTAHDEKTFEQLQYDEVLAKETCREKIQARELPMKLVEVEYSFDRRKVIFYFTAEDRVDFRELVRDLAQDLKARIELRHIQVRDAAKMVGGIGTCGRELCCTTWMREFIPISMKMAKRQNLSLNPSKISGQCGRLMCCLSYENDLYSKARHDKTSKIQAGPSDHEALRDRMEADAPNAAKVLQETSLRDVNRDRPRRQRGRGHDSAPTKPGEVKGRGNASGTEPRDGAQAKAKPGAQTSDSQGQTSDPKRSRRRKRRRRRRAGGQGGQGGQGGAPPSGGQGGTPPGGGQSSS